MIGNNIFTVVFWSSLFGAVPWAVFWVPGIGALNIGPHIEAITWVEQLIILPKTIAMTLSWLFAYYSVRELPMSFSGAVRASGPIITFMGAAAIFGETLSVLQFTAILTSIIAYYFLSGAGKIEGILLFRNKAVYMMLIATILSAMTTVYDKYMVSSLSVAIYSIQAYSALHRCILSFIILLIVGWRQREWFPSNWTVYIPLVGLSWVGAEAIHFLALTDPAASATYLAVFRRMSLVVGFILAVVYLGERQVFRKSICIAFILLGAIVLIIEK
jgi:drug/metabolite transporter (DMT)-like permease